MLALKSSRAIRTAVGLPQKLRLSDAKPDIFCAQIDSAAVAVFAVVIRIHGPPPAAIRRASWRSRLGDLRHPLLRGQQHLLFGFRVDEIATLLVQGLRGVFGRKLSLGVRMAVTRSIAMNKCRNRTMNPLVVTVMTVLFRGCFRTARFGLRMRDEKR